MATSRPLWMTLMFTVVFILLIVAAFFLSYRYMEQISNVSKTVTSLVERKVKLIPTTVSVPNIQPLFQSMKSRISSTLSTRNLHTSSSGMLRTEFNNPLFSDDRSSNGSAAEETMPNELAYSNPLYVEENTHAAPFSGIQVTYTNKFAP